VRIRRDPRSFDDAFYDRLAELARDALRTGKTEGEALDLAAQSIVPSLDRAVPGVVARLSKTTPRMLRQHRRVQRGFERRLRKHWGEALDRFYAVVVCAEEAGSDFNAAYRPTAVEKEDFVFEVLAGMHARSCRISLEVHRLLSSGFPMGALARCRSLHEIAVAAGVVHRFGREPDSLDLAERFLLHEHVQNWKDAQEYQRNCASIGYEPFSDEEMATMRAARDAVIDRFGESFGQDNGWAADLLKKRRVSFVDLEHAADLDHLRPFYKWGSHEVHGDAKGWSLNRLDRGGVTYLSTGHTNAGLADPGQLALISLTQCTVSLLLCTQTIRPQNLISTMVIQAMLEPAHEAFMRGHDSVTAAEQRHQAQQLAAGS
jgi:hypothetical protein